MGSPGHWRKIRVQIHREVHLIAALGANQFGDQRIQIELTPDPDSATVADSW